jgi:AraC-like DNA-binding protein
MRGMNGRGVDGDADAEYTFAKMDANRAHWTVPRIHPPPRDLQRYLDTCFTTRSMSSPNPDERGRRMPEGASYIVLLRGRTSARGSGDQATLVVGGAQDGVHDIPSWDYEYQCGVRIQPGATSAVLGESAKAIKNSIVPLRAFWEDRADRLLDRLLAARSESESVLLLHEAVRDRLRESAAADLLAVRLARAIRGAPGDTRLAALARDYGTTVRTLERKFDEHIGIGPKQYQRIARIARVFGLIGRSGREWAAVAAECGYYDQSHLVDDCHEILGHSPDRFLRRLTNVSSLEIGLVFERNSRD